MLLRKRLLWSVSLAHMTNDMFMGMGPVLLTYLSVSVLPIGNAEIGLAVGARQLVGSLSQPLFGWLADRSGGRWMGAGGVAWTVSLLMLSLALAQTGQFWLMVIPYALSALGSGAFHPVGTMYAVESDKEHAASGLSYFFLWGQLGLAIGPAAAGFLLDQSSHSVFTSLFAQIAPGLTLAHGSVTSVFALALVAVPAVSFMAMAVPNARDYRQANGEHTTHVSTASKSGAIPWKAFLILGTMVTLRSVAQPGAADFVPRLFQHKGWSPSEYGLISSTFWIAGGLAGILFGLLADRSDQRVLIALSLLLSAPAFFLLPLADGPSAFGLTLAAGALSGGSHSLIVVMAQALLPGRRGFASGAILGFIFATGALGSFLIGAVSERTSLTTAFQMAAVLIVASSGLALALPIRPLQPAQPVGESTILPESTV